MTIGTVVDTPDGQYGTVSPQTLLGTFATASATVTLPPNAESLLIFTAGVVSRLLLTVVGVTSGVDYRWSAMPLGPGGDTNPVYVVSVIPAVDSQVTITWAAGVGTWFAVADSAIRQTLDQYLSQLTQFIGSVTGNYGLLALGSDGTDARALLTDTLGRLITSPAAGAPTVPNASVQLAVTGTPANILAAPGSGNNYLFGVTINSASNTGVVTISAGGVIIWEVNLATIATAGGPLFGYKTNGAVSVVNATSTCLMTLMYAAGP